MAGGSVLVERDGAIATVTLSSPGRMNALDKTMWAQLGAAMQRARRRREPALRRDPRRRRQGLRRRRRHRRVQERARQRRSRRRPTASGGIGWMHAVAECRHPTVALIQGACVGGGLLIASQCDLRICNESARFGVPVKNLGLTESYDELQAMMRVIGPAASLEILLEGRIWGAREAYEKGLVTRVVPDAGVVEEAYATARRIADGAPLVARWHKKFIRRLLDPRPLTQEERDEGYACFDTEDFRTGVAAFLAKKKPDFTGPLSGAASAMIFAGRSIKRQEEEDVQIIAACGACRGRLRRAGADLAEQAGHVPESVPGRRRNRHLRAADRGAPVRDARPAGASSRTRAARAAPSARPTSPSARRTATTGSSARCTTPSPRACTRGCPTAWRRTSSRSPSRRSSPTSSWCIPSTPTRSRRSRT